MTPSGARFSSCRRWRTLLWRCWDAGKPVVNFIMLNPSTADETILDPTCTRARSYAERWGYGSLLVTNIFAWCATKPARMRAAADPVGTGNDMAIVRAARASQLVVCAWGDHARHLGRSSQVQTLLREACIRLHCLRVNASGEPAHPLYLPGTLRPKPWK